MNEIAIKKLLEESLNRLGVMLASSKTDPLRWTPSDLATDLADLLVQSNRITITAAAADSDN